MAVGFATQRAEQYQGKVTAHVTISCILASIGGLIFGYVGIPGGVTLREGILDFFYDEVYYEKRPYLTNYCKYDKAVDIAYLPSLYLPAMVASLVASLVTRKYGRTRSIIISGVSFGVGAILNALDVENVASAVASVVGRILLGVGVGFGIQAISIYLSEIAPKHFRGGLSATLQVATSLGIFIANIVNYKAEQENKWGSRQREGFRLSFGLAVIPAVLMILGGIFISETPNSLMQRGSKNKGRKVLEKIRGTEDVEAEFQDMVDASGFASTVKHPIISIFRKKNRPYLVMAILMPMFQILTGIYSLIYYAPVLFLNMGFQKDASFYSSAIIGAVLVSAALLSITTVDKLGRRALLIGGGIQMTLCQVIIAIILAVKLGDYQDLSKDMSILVMVVFCLFALAFGWSWGPLGWTIPSEIFPLEIRSVGLGITVAVNLLVTLIITQSFLPLLCAIRYGVFLFYAGWIAVMTIFVFLFLPETKGVPIEEMASVWRNHWFWKRMVPASPEVDGAMS